MFKHRHLFFALSLVAQTLFSHLTKAQTDESPLPSAFTIVNAQACLAKLNNKDLVVQFHGNSAYTADYQGLSCYKMQNEAKCILSAGDSNEIFAQLTITENTVLSFKNNSRSVTSATNIMRAITEIYTYSRLENGVLETLSHDKGQSLNPDNIAGLSPQERPLVKAWMGFGIQDCSPSPIS